jgi:hypothetical protein
MKSIYPYILIAFRPAIPYFPAIPRMVVMLGRAAILRRPAIPRMVALSGIAHHVIQPRDDHYLLTWTPMALSYLVTRQGENPSCYL